MIAESKVKTFLRNHSFDYGTVQIRSPFNGMPLDSHMLFRKDTKHILKVGIDKADVPFTNLEACEPIRRLSDHISVNLLNVHHDGKDTIMSLRVGRSRGIYMKIGDIKIEKRLLLSNSNTSKKVSLTISPSITTGGIHFEVGSFPTIHEFHNTNLYSEHPTENTANMINAHFDVLSEIYNKMLNTQITEEYAKSTTEILLKTASTQAQKEVYNSIMFLLEVKNPANLFHLHLFHCRRIPNSAQKSINLLYKKT